MSESLKELQEELQILTLTADVQAGPGAFVRALRDGKWQSLDVTELTNEELKAWASSEYGDGSDELQWGNRGWSWAIFFAAWIREKHDEATQGLERELNDAICVINGHGLTRSKCPSCERLTLTPGYVCWACGADPSEEPR